MEDPGLALALKDEMGLVLKSGSTLDEIRRSLATHITHLINNDFNQLVSLLYRIDVSENKLKHLLRRQEGQDSGQLIADLIIERQLQKIRSRKESRKSDPDTGGDERW